MKFSGLLLFSILFFPFLIMGQGSCNDRYLKKTFNSIQIFRNVVYTKNSPKLIAASLGTETVISINLVMDIFMPPTSDTVIKRPVVIVAHGGGFIDVAFMGGTLLVGTKDNQDVQALCDTLAHWGYVTACIEYRTGFDVASTTSIKRAVWRGAQDMSAAIRFFRKNATWFNIDPEKIFTAGSSAGAFCAIHSAFVDNSERIPESFQQSFVMADLGGLHSRPVVQLSSFNPFSGNNTAANDVDSIPMGVTSFWGAIADTNWLSGQNKSAIRMFHGDSDIVVSAQCASPFSGVVLAAPPTCGTEVMGRAMTSINIPHRQTIESGQGHEYWGALNGSWSNGPNSYWLPIIDSTASFFYDLMRPAAPVISGSNNFSPGQTYRYSVTSPNTGSEFCWEIDGGTVVSPNTSGAFIDVIFNSGISSATVKCSEIDDSKVISIQQVKIVSLSTAVPELQNVLNFNLFPNPNKGIFSVELEQNPDSEFNIEVFDFLGRKLYTDIIRDRISNIEIRNLVAGQYFVKISNAHFSENRKMIIYL
jgi:hypothetical protein